jgi:DNA-binding SARP family transcriptional activator
MEPALHIRSFGSLELLYPESRSGSLLPLLLPATLKSQSLLVYLAVHRRYLHSRNHLAELFWGDRPERKARHSLSTALWQIRRCLPRDDYLLCGAANVQFNPSRRRRRGQTWPACTRPWTSTGATSSATSTTTG